MADLGGVWTATQNSTIVPSENRWWLKDPLDNNKNLAVRVEDFSQSPREEIGVFDGIGREDPVVASDGRKGWEIRTTLRTENKADFDKLDEILKTGKVLLLQDGSLPVHWYVKALGTGGWDRVRAADPTGTYPVRHLHRMSVTFVTARLL